MGKQYIARCSPDAKQQGVRIGMTLASARTLLSHPEVIPFQPQREVSALRRLAEWAMRFSPIVSPDSDPFPSTKDRLSTRDIRYNGIHLDVTGSERLFSGDENLLHKIDSLLDSFSLRYRAALAPTLGAAWALSRYAKERTLIVSPETLREKLNPLSVAALRLSPDLETRLRELNIKTLGELLQLPPSSLLSRFGKELPQRIDQALGRGIEPIEALRIIPLSAVEKVFEGPTKDRELLKVVAWDLLEDLLTKLQKKQLQPSHIRLQLTPPRGPSFSRDFTLAVPTYNIRHIGKLLEKKLDDISAPDGIELIRLVAERTENFSAKTTSFLALQSTNRDGEEKLGELIDTLIANLGAQRVLKVSTHASYLPEQSFAFRPVNEKHHDTEIPEQLADRPSLLLTSPHPIRAMATLPDGPPFWVKWKEDAYEVRRCVGPERIASQWWREESISTRDYFKVQIPTGAWLWVFRELESSNWFLHGIWS